MNFIAKNKSVGLFIIFLVTLPYIGWFYSQNLLANPQTKEFIVTVLNGFWTAFFSLVFLGVTYFFKSIITKQKRHYNSLAKLETQLNEMIGIIKDNNFTLEGFRNTVTKGHVYWASTRPIIGDKSHYENIADLDLVNRVFVFFYSVRRINNDMANLMDGYTDLKNAYIQKYIKADHYIDNAIIIANEASKLEKANEKLYKTLINLYARVRLQAAKDRPFTIWLLDKMVDTSGKRITALELEREVKKLNNELRENSQKK